MVRKPDFSIGEIRFARSLRVDLKLPYKRAAEMFKIATGKYISYRTIHKWETEWGWKGTEEKYRIYWKDWALATKPMPPKPPELMTEKEWEKYSKEIEEWAKEIGT